jgi:asparagine N-glycosylation enzyme membrane subunit Stt3
MLTLLCALLILIVVVVFLFWLIDQAGVQPPTAKMLRILVCAVAAIIVIGYFAGFWGGGFKWR